MSTFEIIAAAVGLVVTYVLPWATKHFVDYLKAKKMNIVMQKGLVLAATVVSDIVRAAEQTAVKGLKAAREDGKITDEEYAKIKSDVWSSIKKTLGDSGWNGLKDALGIGDESLTTMIDAKIESAVHEVSKESKVNPTN